MMERVQNVACTTAAFGFFNRDQAKQHEVSLAERSRPIFPSRYCFRFNTEQSRCIDPTHPEGLSNELETCCCCSTQLGKSSCYAQFKLAQNVGVNRTFRALVARERLDSAREFYTVDGA